MYENLVVRLNEYSGERECHGGITAEAADAIKHQNELIKALSSSCEQRKRRISFLEECIERAIDALDRGTDNDWARGYLERAEE